MAVITSLAVKIFLGMETHSILYLKADAVTVTHPPVPELERLNNHQTEVTELTGGSADHQVHRPHFQTYSETAPARISTKHAGGNL